MKIAANELGKRSAEGENGSRQVLHKKGPSSVRPPWLGGSGPAQTWRRADHFSSLFFVFLNRFSSSELF